MYIPGGKIDFRGKKIINRSKILVENQLLNEQTSLHVNIIQTRKCIYKIT